MQHPRIALIYGDSLRPDTTGGPELLPDEPRHLGGDNYGFADGRVQWLQRKMLPDGTWAKEPADDRVTWEPVLKKPDDEPHD